MRKFVVELSVEELVGLSPTAVGESRIEQTHDGTVDFGVGQRNLFSR